MRYATRPKTTAMVQRNHCRAIVAIMEVRTDAVQTLFCDSCITGINKYPVMSVLLRVVAKQFFPCHDMRLQIAAKLPHSAANPKHIAVMRFENARIKQ